ncbi:carotenoid synthesis regulator CarF [Corallococcus sp. H22C18031201]|uniref:plasmanylethanolamine desaturase n=1 Tax=Citreicoccus inhibens TaxID=2849499 RepID=UPI000E717E3E|nr:fatty acid desaturase family protein [Citreicoccus inhibens]MBU8895944.1 fatty acid desaturase family protein [Citreicoccus inhibens]RJS25826.1 carotenoid synthesis regulator CarF [Corallococcus sp. H22C18031201]
MTKDKALTNKVRLQDAQALAEGYSPAIRAMEISAIVGFIGLEAFLAYRLSGSPHHGPWMLLSAVLLGYMAADFVSGFVHWMGDTWGSTDMPVLGKAFIRPFREHHVDEKAITRHDFVETNGNNCLVSLPVAAIAVALPMTSPGWVFMASFLGAMIFWVMATNQFHKWSHTDAPPAIIGFMQRVHLILPPAHHRIHHTAPFNKYYCITVGWLNRPLQMVHFFPTLERIITRVTGLLPRQDDIGAEAAQAIVEANVTTDAPVVQAARELLKATTEEAPPVPTRPST